MTLRSAATPRFDVEEDALGGFWLVLNKEVDAETEAEISVNVAVSDGELTGDTDVTIEITNVNEPPTIELEDGYTPGGKAAYHEIEENKTGPVAEVVVSDPEDVLTGPLTASMDGANFVFEDTDGNRLSFSVSDDRFIVKEDPEGGLWVVLNDEVSYEDVDSIDVTVTVTDSGGLIAMVENYTITILDVNDAPTANQVGVTVVDNPATMDVDESATPVTSFDATAGEDFEITVDLTDMFSDEDGDSLFAYTLQDAPDWLTVLRVEYDDERQVTGYVLDVKPPAGDDKTAEGVKIVATDQGGASGYAMFDIIVDDGNDVPTAIDLTNLDGTDNAFFDLEVDEHATGTMLGYVSVDDQDDPRHSHGKHVWKVDDDNDETFEIVEMNGRQVLKLKDDATIDFEAAGGDRITLTVTATDGGGAAKSQTIQVEVNNMNDPVVVKNAPGDWWVTIDDDTHDPETVAKGAYLTFSLEVEGIDTLPLFTDEDAADASIPDPSDPTMSLMIGKLTYAIVDGPDWLEIDMNGVFTNKAGAEDDELPERGVYDITVSATDGAGDTAQATFKLAVAVSGAADADNEDPDIGSRQEFNVLENSLADTVVATFTVTDEDLDLADGDHPLHPWSDVTVVIENVMGSPTDGGDAMAIDGTPLKWVEVSRDSDSITYNVVVDATGVESLNYETYDEITFDVRAYDGVADAAALTDQNSDVVGFDFEITDVNEASVVDRDTGAHSSDELGDTDMPAVMVEQSESFNVGGEADDTGKITLYINLSNYFDDRDEDDDDDELTYSVSEDRPWISITHDVGEWRDVQEGPDGEDDTMDDVTWGPSEGPDDRDYVVVLEIDRTGMNNSQDADGSFTITVTDVGGASSEHTVMVTVTDENLSPGAMAEGVKLDDDTPYQNDRIIMQFDDSVDPDFTGAEGGEPILELFEWRIDDTPDTTDDAGTLISVSAHNPERLTVKQGHVGDVIQGVVVYFELFDGKIVISQGGTALEDRSMVVQDRADPATGTITFTMTNSDDELVAIATVDDLDGIVGDVTYTWEYSTNSRGGWEADTTDTDNDLETSVPGDHEGKFVRLVATFTDSNGTPERVESTQRLKVGVIDTIDTPTITGFGGETNPAVGRTLEIDVEDADVEWLVGTTVVGTGTEFLVTSAQAGMAISARITSKDGDDNVTSIVTTEPVTVAGTPAVNTQAIAVEDVLPHLVGKAPAMAGELEEYTATIDASELFEDIEGDLIFSFAGATGEVGDDRYGDETLDVNLNNAGDQLLVIDETTGVVRYYTTKATEHGDGGRDGEGNVVTITVTATDGTNKAVTNDVLLAIDVPGSYNGDALTTIVAEHTEMTEVMTTATEIGTVNITDLNSPTNAYGQYDWMISDPSRFTVTKVPTDTSMAVVALKAGQTFEIDPDNGMDGTVMVTITATPLSGGKDITITLTVTVTNNDDDDPEEPGAPNEVPGLKDNEMGSDTNVDDETEDGDDDDDDAGTAPEANAMAAFASMLDDGIF